MAHCRWPRGLEGRRALARCWRAALVASVWLTATPARGDYQLLFPNGGEVFAPGEELTVTWQSSDMGPSVDVLLSPDGGLWWEPLTTDSPDDGSEIIRLGESAGSRFLLRVMESESWPGSERWDTSDAAFSVDDAFEPNDQFAAAASLAPGLAEQLLSLNDDWFALTTTASASVGAAIVFDGDLGSLELSLFAADGVTLLAAGTTGDSRAALLLTDAPAGTYLVQVSPTSSSAGVPYSLALSSEGGLGSHPGEDWYLPPDYRRHPDSGFFSFNTNNKSSRIPIAACSGACSWAALNPADPALDPTGAYDFSPIWDALAALEGTPFKLGLRITSTVEDRVPQWVIDKHQPWSFVSPLWAQTQICPWHPGVEAEYTRFIEALGASGIPQEPKIVFSYIHGFSTSRGEELYFDTADFAAATQPPPAGWGMTAPAYGDWLRRRIDLWLAAFAGVESKLMWVGDSNSLRQYPPGPGTGPGFEYETASSQACQHLIDQGGANRGGFIERYHGRTSSMATGQGFERDPLAPADGMLQAYVVTDPDHPVIAEGRATADENEEYGGSWCDRFPWFDQPHRWHESTLRTLSMQLRFSYITETAYEVDRSLADFAQRTFGKTVHTSADSWSYLREGYLTANDTDVPWLPERWIDLAIKNFERFLYQRDLPGGMTVATLPCYRSNAGADNLADPPWGTGPPFDMTARRTDLATGNDRIHFDLDERFSLAPGETALLKVTWCDGNLGRWRVEYSSGGAEPLVTPYVQGSNAGPCADEASCVPAASDYCDPARRCRCEGPGLTTTRFWLHGFSPDDGLPHAQDLAIVAEDDDVTVRFVRLLKWPEPTATPYHPDGPPDGGAGGQPGAGPPDEGDDGGCGCRLIAGGRPALPPMGLLALLSIGFAARRARRR